MKRNLSISEHGMICALLLIGVAVTLACTGCATPRQHFYAGQGFDFATTYYALEVDDGFKEANPLAESTAINRVVFMKLAGVALIETLAHLCPEQADTIYKIGAFAGYGAGAWNTYQVVK